MKVSFKDKASLFCNIISQPEQQKNIVIVSNCISVMRVLVHFTYRVHRLGMYEILELKRKNFFLQINHLVGLLTT